MKLLLLVFFIIFFMRNTHSSIWPTFKSNSTLNCYRRAAVSTDTAPCAKVAKYILKKGGSAVDAAISMLVCLATNHPQSSGFGGGFFMVYYNRSEKRSHVIDAREVAPRAAYRRWMIGPKNIAVPGEVAGYEKAHSLFGRLPWKEIFKPSIKMCKEGILVTDHLAAAIKKLPRHEPIRKYFLKDGNNVYREGDRIKRPMFARTLKTISKIGKRAIYGPSKMAKSFLRDLKAAGSLIDEADLRQYKARYRKSININFRNGFSLHTSPFPSSGFLLATMLGILDGFHDMNKAAIKHDDKAADFMHRMIEVSSLADKMKHLVADSNLRQEIEIIKRFTSKSFLEEQRRKINPFGIPFLRHRTISCPSRLKTVFNPSTSHISVVAPDGDAVSVTASINSYFGSNVISPSTGIILNNHMKDFDDEGRNTIKPGKRPRSAITPAIFTDRKGDVRIVLGASGSDRIKTTVMQVAARLMYFGENIKQGIDAPRFHSFYPSKIEYERTYPREMINRQLFFGHSQILKMPGRTVVQGIQRTSNGYVCANSDYRKEGKTSGLN